MWFMPSYGRAKRLQRLEEAPGGWPEEIILLVNEDDPDYSNYISSYWALRIVPAGSRCADVHRFISERWPDEPFYGLLQDDLWPITPQWHERLVAAAENRYIAIPRGPGFPHSVRSACVIGGDLARAMGSLVPIPVRHWYEDDVWDDIGAHFDCMRAVESAYVEHQHWSSSENGADDATYRRARQYQTEDMRIFKAWKTSPERTALLARIAPLFNGQ